MNDDFVRETLTFLIKTAREHQIQISMLLRSQEVQADLGALRDEQQTDLNEIEKKAAAIVESHKHKLDELLESGDETSRKLDEMLQRLKS